MSVKNYLTSRVTYVGHKRSTFRRARAAARPRGSVDLRRSEAIHQNLTAASITEHVRTASEPPIVTGRRTQFAPLTPKADGGCCCCSLYC